MIGAGIVIVGVVIYFVTRGGGGDKPKTVQPLVPTTEQPVAQQPTNTAVPFADDQPRVQQPTRPDPAAAAAGLERDLKRQRLWSTVTVTGNRVEVRSGSCEDPAMAPLLDAAVTDLKAAGIARMRCVEQGGRVVSDREL